MLETDITAILLLVSQVFFVVAAVVFAISAIDDLLIDIYFFFKVVTDRLLGRSKYPGLTVSKLREKQEQAFALMLPAWSESEVIFDAVSNMIRTIDYENYHIFIGVYPNDADTQSEVDRLTRRFERVHKVVTKLPGPTCKADCLNQIIDHVNEYESRYGTNFAGVIMQDAEDVVHPLSVRLFNYLVPEYDLVQIPVYSLKRRWFDVTGGHYMDEFAEFHSKEILVREWFANVVPGAGVGTAYSRRALQFAADTGYYFSTNSLTEDYEFSFRMRDAGLRQTFAHVPIPEGENMWRSADDDPADRTANFIATREFFPNGFWASVRQKARWTIGISFQGWRSFGWRGDWRTKYLFWRDRKMLFFSHAIALGFLSIVIYALYQARGWMEPNGYQFAPLLAEDSPFWYLAYFNLFMVAFRLAQRHAWSFVYYGWASLPMVLPRYIWGTAINYLAIIRATRIYVGHMMTGRAIGWDKTAHDFPELEGASRFRQYLGDLLVERGLITTEQRDEALARQERSGGQLGEILTELGYLHEQRLFETIGDKFHLQIRDIDPFLISGELLRVVPFDLVRKHHFVPFDMTVDGRLEIASCEVLGSDAIEEIEAAAGRQIIVHLATRSDIFFALHTFSRLVGSGSRDAAALATIHSISERINGFKVVEMCHRAKPIRAAHLSFGQRLVRAGQLTYAQLDDYVKEAVQVGIPLGQHLVEQGVISRQQCQQIVSQIDSGYRDILENYFRAIAA